MLVLLRSATARVRVIFTQTPSGVRISHLLNLLAVLVVYGLLVGATNLVLSGDPVTHAQLVLAMTLGLVFVLFTLRDRHILRLLRTELDEIETTRRAALLKEIAAVQESPAPLARRVKYRPLDQSSVSQPMPMRIPQLVPDDL